MKGTLLIAVALLIAAVINAQAKSANVIERDSFLLKYPADWKIDTQDEDYDPDAFFSLESPDDNLVMFMIFNVPVDKDELLKAQLEAFSSQLIKKPEITEFNKWGDFYGMGKILKGKILGVFKGVVRIFVYETPYKTMLVVEQYYDKDHEKLKKDYDLISTSFSFK